MGGRQPAIPAILISGFADAWHSRTFSLFRTDSASTYHYRVPALWTLAAGCLLLAIPALALPWAGRAATGTPAVSLLNDRPPPLLHSHLGQEDIGTFYLPNTHTHLLGIHTAHEEKGEG